MTAPRPPRPLLRLLPCLAALLLLAGPAAALHEPPARVSLAGGPVLEVQPVDRTVSHTVSDAVGIVTSPIRPSPVAAPAPERSETEAAAPPAATFPLVDALPAWAVPAALGLLALLALVTLVALAVGARRRRAHRAELVRLREERDLSRTCAEAASLRAVRLQEANDRLREDVGRGRAGVSA